MIWSYLLLGSQSIPTGCPINISNNVFQTAQDILSFDTDTFLILPEHINRRYSDHNGTYIPSCQGQLMVCWLKYQGIKINQSPKLYMHRPSPCHDCHCGKTNSNMLSSVRYPHFKDHLCEAMYFLELAKYEWSKYLHVYMYVQYVC